MTQLSEAAKLIKSGFIRIDPETNAVVQALAVQHNPKTLSRALVNSPSPVPGSEPREVVTLTLALDATDQKQVNDGIHPLLSALELLLYVPAGPPAAIPLIVFVWGGKRVLPVHLTEFHIVEQAFDAVLNPIRAEIAVTMHVLKDADLPAASFGRRLWDEHVLKMRQLAANAPAATLADLGLSAV